MTSSWILPGSCFACLLAGCDEGPPARLTGEPTPATVASVAPDAASASVDAAARPESTPGIFAPARGPVAGADDACLAEAADASAARCGPTQDASAATDSPPVAADPTPSSSTQPEPAPSASGEPTATAAIAASPEPPEPNGSEAPGAASEATPSEATPPEAAQPTPAPALPDLVLDAEYLRTTVAQDFVDASADPCLLNEGCVTGSGLRRVVRFGTRSGNIGNADLKMGTPSMANPLWEFDECHEHYHFEGYARYDLIDTDTTQLLPIGYKNGFCLRDNGNWDLDAATAGCAEYTCEDQGLGQGCADVYTPDLPCQWLDITDVAPGTYALRVSINAEQSLAELSFDNNSASVRIQITDTSVAVAP